MDLLLPVFQLLYFVAHFLVSVLQAVYGTYMDVLQITHFLYQKLTHTVHAQEQYNEGKGKLPEHPAVVFLPGHYLAAQLPQLVSLMTAFVKAGAKQITLYDPAGKIEEQQDELLLCLTRSLPGSLFLLLQHPLEQINEEPQKEQAHARSLVKGATAQTPVVYVSIVNCDSGVRHLLNCVRKLARQPHSSLTNLSPHDLDSVLAVRQVSNIECHDEMSNYCSEETSRLVSNPSCNERYLKNPRRCAQSAVSCSFVEQKSLSCMHLVRQQDPDMMIVIGDYMSSGGFPPWGLRLTEFAQTSSLGRIDSAELQNLFRSYAGIEKRFGR